MADHPPGSDVSLGFRVRGGFSGGVDLVENSHIEASRAPGRPRSRARGGVFTTISTSCPSAVRQRGSRSLEQPVSRPLISAEILGRSRPTMTAAAACVA